MEQNDFRFAAVSEDEWRELRGVWLDMSAAQPSDDVETIEDASGLTQSQWRARAKALTGLDCFAEALIDAGGRWLGFVCGYFDDLARDRHAFVSHLYARHGDLETEALLLERVAAWAGLHGAEAVVVGIGEDRHDLLARFEDHGFRRSGVRRRLDVDPSRFEVELVFDLAATALAAQPHVSLRSA